MYLIDKLRKRHSVPLQSKDSFTHLFQSVDCQFAISLADHHWITMSQYCLRNLKVETGGILVGHYDEDLRTALLTEALGPPKDSIAGPTWFERGTYGVNKYLAKVERERGDHYLGEWHFHPSGSLLPSNTDITYMTRISSSPDYNCSEPLLIIAGRPDPTFSSKRISQIPHMRCFVFPMGKDWRELKPLR